MGSGRGTPPAAPAPGGAGSSGHGVGKLRGRTEVSSDCQPQLRGWDTSEVTSDRSWGVTAVSQHLPATPAELGHV